MKRWLYLKTTAKPLIRPKQKVITPTRQAAKALSVPHLSLERLARKLISDRNLSVASPLKAQRTLHQAVAMTSQITDIEGTARVFWPTLKVLFRAGINLEALKNYPASRIQPLVTLAIIYQQLLREQGLIEASELYWQASQSGSQAQSLLIYGYFQPRQDELTLINAIATEGSIFVLPCDETDIFANNQAAVKWLQHQGWTTKESSQSQSPSLATQLQQDFLKPAPLPDTVQFHAYPTIEAEVRGVLASVKILLNKGVTANEIVLVSRDEVLYGATLIDIAWEYNLPVKALYRVPVQETRIGAWLKLLLDVIEADFPFEETAKLLGHPLFERLSPEMWAKARQEHPQGDQAWSNLGIDLTLFHWPQQDERDAWMQRLQIILNHYEEKCAPRLPLGGEASGSLRDRTAKEYLALSRIQIALVELSKPEIKCLTLTAFIQEVREALALLSVPAQPGRGGVELHSPLSLFGANYAHVFVLGATEGILPAPLTDDPVLDFYERQQLVKQGIPLDTAIQSAYREALSFYFLLRVAQQSLTFSYPLLLGKESTLPSPYLNRLGLKATTPPPLPLASLEEARRLYLAQDTPETVSFMSQHDRIFPNIVRVYKIEQRRESEAIPNEYEGIVGIALNPAARVFSASQLTALGQCPFKWFAARILGLKALPEADSELTPTLRGQLYHRCLELALREVKTANDLISFPKEQLETAFLQAEQDLAFPEFSAWEMRRTEHINLLQLNLTATDFLPPDQEILALETTFETQWYGLKVVGQVDRIDRTTEGLMVIDYKTSSTISAGIKDPSGKAKIDIQLPLYMDAIAQTFPNETVTNASYYSLTKQKVLAHAKRDEDAMSAFAEKVKWHLETGSYPVEPDIEQKACTYCAFDLVCRRGNRVERRVRDEG